MIISIIREDSHDPKTQKQTSKDDISKTDPTNIEISSKDKKHTIVKNVKNNSEVIRLCDVVYKSEI